MKITSGRGVGWCCLWKTSGLEEVGQKPTSQPEWGPGLRRHKQRQELSDLTSQTSEIIFQPSHGYIFWHRRPSPLFFEKHFVFSGEVLRKNCNFQGILGKFLPFREDFWFFCLPCTKTSMLEFIGKTKYVLWLWEPWLGSWKPSDVPTRLWPFANWTSRWGSSWEEVQDWSGTPGTSWTPSTPCSVRPTWRRSGGAVKVRDSHKDKMTLIGWPAQHRENLLWVYHIAETSANNRSFPWIEATLIP